MVAGDGGESFLQEICVRAAATPGKAALLCPGKEPVGYAALCGRARVMVGALAREGLERGDIVAAALPDSAEVLCACLGVAGIGAFAPLNPALPQDEHDYFLRSLGAAALIAPRESAAAAAARALGIRVLEMASLAAGGCAAPFPAPAGRDPALFLHTSATTGRPKLVCITHAKLLAMARASIVALEQAGADRMFCMMPMFHLQGLRTSLDQLMVGASVVLASAAEAAQFPRWLDEFRPTWYTAGATLHRAILASLRNAGKPARGYLRFIRNIGAALPLSLEKELEETFEAPVINGYGLTETGAVTSSPLPPRVRKPGSAGIAIGAEVAVLEESGRIAAVDAEGEILVRGPGVIDGYWNDPEATRGAFYEGWFRTGDLGRLDAEGYIFINGRIKEMINKGGEKILPNQIDEALMAHPEVAEASAFAVPHPTLGEDVAAAVVLRSGAALKPHELRRFAAGRLAYFKVPRRILFVDSIPKSATGKPQRHVLAEMAGGPGGGRAPFTRETETALAECWTRFLPGSSFGADDDFFELGGDSLSARMMLVEVQDKFGALASEGEFLIDPTIATLASLLETNGRAPAAQTREALLLFALQPHGSRPPFFCIPGAAEDPYYMRRLARRLGSDQPFYILRDPRPGAGRGEQTVGETAALFAGALRSAQPDGPYLIGGHCYGGVVAFEMARQLTAAGNEVALLVLFDTGTPGYPKVLRNWKRYCLALPQATPAAVVEHIRFLAARGRRKLATAALSTAPSDPAEANAGAARRYVPRSYPGKVFAFLAGDEHHSTRVLDDFRLGWRDFASRGFEATVIPGTHMSMFDEPHVEELANRLGRLLSSAVGVRA